MHVNIFLKYSLKDIFVHVQLNIYFKTYPGGTLPLAPHIWNKLQQTPATHVWIKFYLKELQLQMLLLEEFTYIYILQFFSVNYYSRPNMS